MDMVDTEWEGERWEKGGGGMNWEFRTDMFVDQLLSHSWPFGDPMDCSLPGSSIPGVSQAGILEWVAISFSRGSSYPGMEPASPALQENTAESPVCACVHAKSLQLCPILCDPVDCNPQLLCPWDSPGQNIGLGCHALFQGIFPTQGLNLSYISCIGRHANGRHSLSCHQECTYYLLTHKTNNHKAHLRYFVFFWWTHLDVLL